jgi:uncharacterized RDD family membrane protein YckC
MQPEYPYQAQPQPPYQGQMQPPYQGQSQPPYQAQAQPQLRYIGFWWRVLAYLIDSIILWVVTYIIGFIIGIVFAIVSPGGSIQPVQVFAQVIASLVSLFYFIWMEASFGGTLGKLALGLRVRKPDGSRIGWKEALIRNLILIVEGLTIYIVTIITINNSPLRQRWGDRVAGTVVIKI